MEHYFQNVFYKRLLVHSYFMLHNVITEWSLFEESLGMVSKDLPQHIKDFIYHSRDKDHILVKTKNGIGFTEGVSKMLADRFEIEYPNMRVNYNSLYYKEQGLDYSVINSQFKLSPVLHKTRRLFDFHLYPFEDKKIFFWVIQPNIRKLVTKHTDYVLGQTNSIDVRNVVIAPTLDFELISSLSGFAKNTLLAVDFFSIFKFSKSYSDKKKNKIDDNLENWDKLLQNQNHGVINIDKFLRSLE